MNSLVATDLEAREQISALQQQIVAMNKELISIREAANRAKDMQLDYSVRLTHALAMHEHHVESLQDQAANAMAGAAAATQEARDAAQQAEGTLANIQQYVADVAWSKAGDRLSQWWRDSVAYKDPRLLNLIYNRVLKHLHTLGIKDTSGERRAEPEV